MQSKVTNPFHGRPLIRLVEMVLKEYQADQDANLAFTFSGDKNGSLSISKIILNFSWASCHYGLPLCAARFRIWGGAINHKITQADNWISRLLW